VETLTAVLLILVAIAIVYEIARRIGVPYPTLLVLGGLGLAFIPGLPRIELEPDLVLFVFLPPLLFAAAAESPIRDLRANVVPLVRLSIGLVLFTMVLVAVVAHALVPGLSWAAAFTLGAIVGPTDALAASAVFRRLGAPRIIRTLIEGEALFNMGYYDGFAGGAYSCGRCHTKGWSYEQKTVDGDGAMGPPLTNVTRQFPGATLGLQQQRDFVCLGSDQGQRYGSNGQGTGRMPGFCITPEEKDDPGASGEVGVTPQDQGTADTGGMLTEDDVQKIVEYERSLAQ